MKRSIEQPSKQDRFAAPKVVFLVHSTGGVTEDTTSPHHPVHSPISARWYGAPMPLEVSQVRVVIASSGLVIFDVFLVIVIVVNSAFSIVSTLRKFRHKLSTARDVH
jgi:hypothetical protein